MPYPPESLRQIRKETGNTCEITGCNDNTKSKQVHSVTTEHLLSPNQYPYDGMLIATSIHVLIHRLARTPESIKSISIEAMQAHLYGIASEALSKGTFTSELGSWLESKYNRINVILNIPSDAIPMSETDTATVKAYYKARQIAKEGNFLKIKEV